MATETVDNGDEIKVIYEDDNGNSATATIVGSDVESVRSRADEIVDNHDLDAKAQQK